MNQLAAKEYQLTRIQTGSPVRLVSMLYDGALRFIAEARVAIQAQDIPTRADRLHRATRIIQELNNALEYSVDSEIPHQLATLYEYVEYELAEATTQNQVLPLDNASRVLKELSDAWNTLAEQNVAAQAAPDAAQDAAPPATKNPAFEVDEHSQRVSLTLTA